MTSRFVSWLRWQRVAIVATYTVFVGWLYHQWGFLPQDRIIGTPASDHVQQVWFVAWPAHALAHGLNPFVSTWMNYPHGLNLMTNTSALLLGTLVAPVTWVFGPLASYALLLEAGLLATALTGAYVLRRVGASYLAAGVGGAVWGFSATHLVRGDVYVFFTWQIVTPLLALLLLRFLQGEVTPRRFGLLLSLLFFVDVMTSLETTYMDLFFLALVALGWAWRRRHERAAVARLARGLFGGVVVGGILTALPLWYFFFGPQAISGPPHTNLLAFHSTLATYVSPGNYAWWAPFGRQAQANLFVDPQGVWNNPSYVGLGVIVVGLLGAWWTRREAGARTLGAIAIVAFLLSFGTKVTLPGTHVALPMPYALLRHLPLFASTMPMQFERYLGLVVAWWVACAITRAQRAKGPAGRTVGVGLVVALVVATLLPNQTYAVSKTTTYPWFHSAEAGRVLREGTVVLSYPYPVALWNGPLLDQAVSGLHYRLIGGQAIVPDAHGTNRGVQPLAPLSVFRVFYHGMWNGSASDPNLPIGTPPPLTEATVADFRSFVREHHVNVVLFTTWGLRWNFALPYLEAAFGPGERRDGGSVRFWRVGSRTTP